MKQFFYYIFIALIIFSCKEKNDDYAYIGGEIINPNTDFVVISKSEKVLDTIKLNGVNRFIYKVDDLEPGLYTFRHGGEIQMVLLEPKDSIMFRLNTIDFDESLVFTGIGDKKNNYLINDYLRNETEEKEIFKFCQLDPSAYQHQIDSLKADKISELTLFQKKYKTSDLFNKIALTSINNNYYASKEIYPFVHYGSNKRAILNSLPKDFYDYRKNIDYNNDFNKDYFNYNSLLRTTFNNLALSEHVKHSDEDFNRKSLCYNLDKLDVVDSLITNEAIKNEMLFYYTVKFLSRSDDPESNNTMLKSFLDKSSNIENKETLTAVVNSLNHLRPGNDFPDVALVDFNNNEVKMNTLVNRPTVIYFWSNAFYDHFKDSHYKAKELTEKYPEVSFIAINVDDERPDLFTESMKRYHFPFQKDFKFKNPKNARLELAVYPMTKTIILNKNNKVVNSNTNIFSSNFEEQLLGLLNKQQ